MFSDPNKNRSVAIPAFFIKTFAIHFRMIIFAMFLLIHPIQ